MIRDLFSDIADVYDRMNGFLSLGLDRRWRRTAAADARCVSARALDLACGTGEFAFALARRCEKAEILGVDSSPAMLEVARRKNKSSRVRFAQGDATNLSGLPEGGFGLCACAFGFRNFVDRRKALSEVRRVLAPGGELLVLEFFRPANTALGSVVSVWIRLVAALFARRKKAAYRHLRESIERMETTDAFQTAAEASGFTLAARRVFFPCCTFLRFVRGTAGAEPLDAEKEGE